MANPRDYHTHLPKFYPLLSQLHDLHISGTASAIASTMPTNRAITLRAQYYAWRARLREASTSGHLSAPEQDILNQANSTAVRLEKHPNNTTTITFFVETGQDLCAQFAPVLPSTPAEQETTNPADPTINTFLNILNNTPTK